jgi:hypothetical protein
MLYVKMGNKLNLLLNCFGKKVILRRQELNFDWQNTESQYIVLQFRIVKPNQK